MAAIYMKRTLKIGILGLSVFYLLSLLWLFSKRLVYPYELDWIEGGMLASVVRILDGHNLYSAPSLEYVPFIYAPAFFYVAALLAKIIGASLLALRLVSIMASLISLLTIVLIVFGETKSWFWGAASAALFAGLYPASRFWFDLARVDSIFLMFFLLFLFSLRRGNSLPWQIATGIFAALTILTKQSGFTMCLPIIAVYVLFDWKRRWVLPFTLALVYGAISLAFIVSSNGWYSYYSYSLLFSQQDNWMAYTVFDFTRDFILPNISVAVVLTLFLFLLWFSRGSKERFWLWLIIIVSTLITSYAGKAKVGGVNNVIIPTFAIFSLLAGIFAAEASKVFQSSSHRYRKVAEVGLYICVLFQLTQTLYNPLVYIPPLEDYRNGAKALKLVKKFDGNVYAPNSAILLMAGKQTFAHPYAIWEILHIHGESRERDALKSELRQAVTNHFFDAIIILPSFEYFPNVEKYYDLDESKYTLMDDTWRQRSDIYVLPSK